MEAIESMRALRALGPALLVGGVFAVFLITGLGASWFFAATSGAAIGVGIMAVVASRPTERDRLADQAWRSAAPDLPPASDRRVLEQAQDTMPGPEKKSAATRGHLRRDEGPRGAVQ
jgi:hypothetical protein